MKARGAKAIKIHADEYSIFGTPDIIGSWPHTQPYGHGINVRTNEGLAYAIEVKTPEGTVSDAQRRQLYEWWRSGARAGVATSANECEAIASGVAPEAITTDYFLPGRTQTVKQAIRKTKKEISKTT